MTISSLAELRTAIYNWTAADDLGSHRDDLINFGERRLNRRLRLLQMETTASVTLTSGNDYAGLPAGFLDILSLAHADTYEILRQITPAKRDEAYTSASDRPNHFAISSQFLFECPADATYTLTCRYVKAWDILTDSTNWLLTNYPEAYLYAALAEAELYTMNDERSPVWDARLERVLADLNSQDARVRSKAPLRMDDALLGRQAFDINRCY